MIWAEKSFTTYHYQEPYVLYTDVRLGPSALSIAFSIEDDDADETLIERHFPPFRWSAPGSREWSGWLVLQVPCEPRGTLPPLAILVEAAAAAYAAAEEAVAAHRLR